MEIALPLEKMSIAEKIQAMEAIWNDLCKKADGVSSPGWHEEVLESREKDIKSGGDGFVDWNKARKNIQDSVS